MAKEAPEPESLERPLEGAALPIVAIALAGATFMQVLDTTIANVSVPTIAGNLGVSADQGTWIITLFAMSNGVAVPLTGWLMDRYGVIRTFVASVALFTLASLLCGLAWNLPSLLLFRILQGACSGPMIPGSQALLLSIFPAAKRGVGLALWSMTTMVAPMAGPILGGWISDNYSWRWIFLINVPVGVLSAIVCYRGLISRETKTVKRPVDMIGFLLLLTWVSSLQIMLDRGEDADWFNSKLIVVLAVTAAVGLVSWLIWELTETNPIVDLSLFKIRSFAIGCMAFCLAYAVFFGGNVLQPLWLQTRLGYVATWAGLVLAPTGAVAIVLTPMFARISGKVDLRAASSLALLAFAISFFMRAHYTPDATFVDLMMPLVVQGVGVSLFFVAMISLQLKDVPPAKLPAASGLSNFARITAAGFAAAATTALWDRRAAMHETRLAEGQTSHLAAWTSAIHGLRGAGFSGSQAVGLLNQQAVNQAYDIAALDMFRLFAILAVVLIPIIWLTGRGKPAGGTPIVAD